MFLFSPLFCFSFSSPPHLNFSPSLAPCTLLSLFLAFCISSTLDLSLYVLHSFASLFFFLLLFSGHSYPSCHLFPCPVLSLGLSLRSQWVWLRGECGVPPLSLAIKAMPTPRLHMSSRPSKRGGVLLIRSVSRNANTPRQTSICRCMFWLPLFVCVIGKKCPSHQVYSWSWKHTYKTVQVFQQVHRCLFQRIFKYVL